MEFREVFRVVQRNWIILVSAIIIGIGVALAYSLVVVPKYSGEVKILFSAGSGAATAQELVAGNNLVAQQATTYALLASTPLILNPAIESLGLDTDAETLGMDVTATVAANSSLLSITASSETAQGAVDLTNAIAANIIAEVGDPAKAPNGVSLAEAKVVQDPVLPEEPSSPILLLNLAIGFAAGIAVAFGIIALREMLNTRLRNVRDVKRVADVPVVGAVKADKGIARGLPLAETATSPLFHEEIGQLRLRVQALALGTDKPVFVVTAGGENEGKTTIASALAIALAESGQRVTLIDGNLRSPGIAKKFGLPTQGGVADVLLGTTPPDQIAKNAVSPELSVITTAAAVTGASELLGTQSFAEIVSSAREASDVVVVDGGPVLSVADGGALAPLEAAIVLLVVRARRAKANDLSQSIDAISGMGGSVRGIVANGIARRGPDSRD